MLNLISDAWIPVRTVQSERRIIAPWQMADPDVIAPDWQRPDLNLACYELLIGLVFMAMPPRDDTAFQEGWSVDPAALKAQLEPYAPAFNLLGEGPRFLQDLEDFSGEANPVDMLFIDSAGGNTVKNNADVMVHRARYSALDLPQAAMALFTFQAFAPAGGAGNRTSMRGGGPLVTLVGPFDTLWQMIWANVPTGHPAQMTDLPWMRPTRLSHTGVVTYPPDGRLFNVEAFFGMPRRLRLQSDGALVTGVLQKPWGTNYGGWKHPLSPYYRMKLGEEALPKHPKAGRFGVRNWLGVSISQDKDGLSELAAVVHRWLDWAGDLGERTVMVGGWSMDNMKPRDFILSVTPLPRLSELAQEHFVCMIKAADQAAVMLGYALTHVLAKGEAREAEREVFYSALEAPLIASLPQLAADQDVRADWLAFLRKQVLSQFEELALPGLDQRESDQIQTIVETKKYLAINFAGYGKQGVSLFNALGLAPPIQKKQRKAA